MNTDTKVIIGISLATVIIIIGGTWLFAGDKTTSSQSVDSDRLIRDHSYISGPATAPVTIVEFADFQCPACAGVQPILHQLKNDYPDDLRVVFRHFPLEQHRHAIPSALAAEAAGDQGNFWGMHDLLLTRQSDWSNSADPKEIFADYARELELDIDQFMESINSQAFKSNIDDDLRDARALRVTSTPTLFINGRQFTASPTYANLKSAIDAEL